MGRGGGQVVRVLAFYFGGCKLWPVTYREKSLME